MSYPPPPGISSNNTNSPASTGYTAPGTTTHSLPPRPSGPPPSFRAFSTAASTPTSTPTAAAAAAASAFAFRPRQVAAPPTHSAQPATYSSGYNTQPRYGGAAAPGSYGASPYGTAPSHAHLHPPGTYGGHAPMAGAPAYAQSRSMSAAPHIVNPFPLPGQQYPQTAHYGAGVGGTGGPAVAVPGGVGGGRSRYTANQPYDPRYPPLDPEMEAQIAQQQSIYIPADQREAAAAKDKRTTTGSVTGANNTALGPLNPAFGGAGGAGVGSAQSGDGNTPGPAGVQGQQQQSKGPKEKTPTVLRQGGGQSWTDSTLLEWDPAHFRLFVGNLAGEVTDESLLKAFAKYPSVQKARVIRDKRTTKSKGYGFVSFSDGDEYFRAAREMNGKYIGSHPVLLKRSNTEIRPVVVGDKKNKKGGPSSGSGVGGGGGGVVTSGASAGLKKKVKKSKTQERKVLG